MLKVAEAAEASSLLPSPPRPATTSTLERQSKHLEEELERAKSQQLQDESRIEESKKDLAKLERMNAELQVENLCLKQDLLSQQKMVRTTLVNVSTETSRPDLEDVRPALKRALQSLQE